MVREVERAAVQGENVPRLARGGGVHNPVDILKVIVEASQGAKMSDSLKNDLVNIDSANGDSCSADSCNDDRVTTRSSTPSNNSCAVIACLTSGARMRIGTTVNSLRAPSSIQKSIWDRWPWSPASLHRPRGRYVKLDSFHTTTTRHSVCHGLKLANPKLNVVVYSGDGDLSAIGGNHLIHAARRNIDLKVIASTT